MWGNSMLCCLLVVKSGSQATGTLGNGTVFDTRRYCINHRTALGYRICYLTQVIPVACSATLTQVRRDDGGC